MQHLEFIETCFSLVNPLQSPLLNHNIKLISFLLNKIFIFYISSSKNLLRVQVGFAKDIWSPGWWRALDISVIWFITWFLGHSWNRSTIPMAAEKEQPTNYLACMTSKGSICWVLTGLMIFCRPQQGGAGCIWSHSVWNPVSSVAAARVKNKCCSIAMKKTRTRINYKFAFLNRGK